MRASFSIASLSASSSSMLVRLCVLLRVMAFESALITKRGLTPVRPSSGQLRSQPLGFGLR